MMNYLEEHGITLESYMDKDTDIICVFGCLLTEAGKKIKEEMLPWILEKYDCIVVNQEPPGKLFEFPAMKMAKLISMKYNKPVLYLHTKGAAHSKNVYDQINCRLIWKDEFSSHYDWYKEHILENESVILLPFCGKQHSTILNGFIASPLAWSKVNIPEPAERYRYEHIFNTVKDVKLIGRLMNDVNFLSVADLGFRRMLKYINSYKEEK